MIRFATGASALLLLAGSAFASTPLSQLEQQAICKGSRSTELPAQLLAAKITSLDQHGLHTVGKGHSLFGLPLQAVAFEWDPDPEAKVTFVTLKGSQRDVSAALVKQGAKLKSAKPPFLLVWSDDGKSTNVMCSWNKAPDMP